MSQETAFNPYSTAQAEFDRIADLIGLDVCRAIMEVLHEELADSKYRPCPLLKKTVLAGHLGRKTGQGSFDYRK